MRLIIWAAALSLILVLSVAFADAPEYTDPSTIMEGDLTTFNFDEKIEP